MILGRVTPCDSEIKAKIGMAKAKFGKMSNIYLSLHVHLKRRLVKSYIRQGMLYACESLTISATMQKRLEAAKMWFIRKMMRVPWTARRINVEVIQMARTATTLMTQAKTDRLSRSRFEKKKPWKRLLPRHEEDSGSSSWTV